MCSSVCLLLPTVLSIKKRSFVLPVAPDKNKCDVVLGSLFFSSFFDQNLLTLNIYFIQLIFGSKFSAFSNTKLILCSIYTDCIMLWISIVMCLVVCQHIQVFCKVQEVLCHCFCNSSQSVLISKARVTNKKYNCQSLGIGLFHFYRLCPPPLPKKAKY